MVLFEHGVLDIKEVQRVLDDEGWSSEQSANLVQDLHRRCCIKQQTANSLYEHIGISRIFLTSSRKISPITIDTIRKSMEG